MLTYKEALSKADPSITDEIRKASMDKVNPKFILRNYLMEESIKKANEDDFSMVEDLLRLSKDPYSDNKIPEEVAQPPPEWSFGICISCSS